MRNFSKRLLIVAAIIGFVVLQAGAWGFWAHRQINKLAVFTLPPEMFGFYKKNIDYLSENAVNPDKRRYANPDEAPRHYIDVDHYCGLPFDCMPKKWEDAVAKYSEDTLLAYGIVPWHIQRMTYRLADAFRDKNMDRILYLSADLGHYIADAHVPLHTTVNYNGQLTNQVGIHGFWESRIPELLNDDYDYFVGKAKFIENPLDQAWQIVAASHAALDSVLTFEKELSKEFPEDRKFAFEQRGGNTVRVYSEEFAKAYSAKMGDMVERRLRESVILTGSYWYTAWVMAGQPDLDPLKLKEISEELKKQMAEDDKMWKSGKAPKGKGHED